jgi:hypothetical protein
VDSLVVYSEQKVNSEYFLGKSFAFGVNKSVLSYSYVKMRDFIKLIEVDNAKTKKIKTLFSDFEWSYLIVLIGE